jgi:uncharacterized membrane protein
MNEINLLSDQHKYRLTAFDLTRLLAMLLMMQGHTLDALANPSQLDVSQFPWSLWSFLRGFTAQIFLVVSGAVQVFANKRIEGGRISKNVIFRRVRMAFILIIIGYMFLFPADRISDLAYLDKKAWVPFLQVNILQLIGFSLLLVITLFTIIRSDKALGYTALSLALIITLLAPFNAVVPWFDYLPEGFAAYLSFEHGSIFPVLPYSAFMLYGVALGIYLKSKKANLRIEYLKNWSAPVGVAFILIGFLFFEIFRNIFIKPELILKVNPGTILFQVGFVLIIIALASLIFSKTEKYAEYYAIFGKKALFIYIAHLLLLYGIPWMPGLAKTHFRQFSILESALVALVVITVCLTVAYLYDWITKKYPIMRKVFVYGTIGAIFAFVFLGNLIAHIF